MGSVVPWRGVVSGEQEREGYPVEAQNPQRCSAAKSVSTCGWGGISESIRRLSLSNRGHHGSVA
ncbi:MAG: hypothetical protein ACRDLN_06765, partial [Solirubrobacteraceae bacterium]